MDARRFRYSPKTARFYENSETDFDVSLNENKNTKRKTETDMRIFSSYLVSINETREPETIPAAELDRHLATYFSVIKKHDGNEYEPASLRGMLCSIERYLRSRNYPVSLTRDADFTNTRNMLKERQKVLRELAKTEKAPKSDPLAINTVQRLNQLYLAKEFGPHNPSAVVNALCFAFVVHLKIRKAIDHKQLLWGDISLKLSSANVEYLCYDPLPGYEYCRLPLKGISGYKVLAQTPEISLWDPVSIYKLYRHKRPSSMLAPDSPFYLGIAIPTHESIQQPWFKPLAMGVNKLNDLVRMIRDITGTLVPGPSYQFDLFDSKDADETETEDENVKVPLPETIETPQTSGLENNHGIDADDIEITKETGTGCLSEITDVCKTLVTFSEDTDRKQKNADVKDNTMETPNMVTDAKHQIQATLDGLTADDKATVLSWLKDTIVNSESEDEVRKKYSRKRLHVSIDLDNVDLNDGDRVEKLARLQMTSEQNGDTALTCVGQQKDGTENQKTSPSVSQDATDGPIQTTNGGNVAIGEIFQDQTDNLHKMRQYVFKRAMSFPSDLRNVKISGNDENDLPVPDFHATTAAQVRGERQTNQTSSAKFPTDIPAPAAPEKLPDLPNPIPGYNPYAAWALDPRFAMFMRNGFMQTYQDFVNMYNNSEAKDTANI